MTLPPTLIPTQAALPTATTRPPATPTEEIAKTMTVTVVAKDRKFSPGTLTIPAHTEVTLVIRNEDSGLSHDIGVNVVGGGRTEACAGPCTASFVFGAHVPGSYHFFCTQHAGMSGDLRVTP